MEGRDWVLVDRPAKQFREGDKFIHGGREVRVVKVERQVRNDVWLVHLSTGGVIDAAKEEREFTIFRPRRKFATVAE